MTLNSYIAIFFSVVFFGKFLVMDSKILVAIFDADEITYVNPFCEKQEVKMQNSNREALAENNKALTFVIHSFCNAPFKFEAFTWQYSLKTEESPEYPHHTFSLPESAINRFYPPPRV